MTSSRLKPVNARLVGWARMGVGLAAVIRAIDGIPVLAGLVANPRMLRAPYISWLRPTEGMIAGVIIVWIASATAFLIGYRPRVAGGILALTIAVVLALDRQTYSNHLYLMMLLVGLLTVAGPGTSLSVAGARRGGASTSSGGGVFLIKAQVSIVYGFAALWKLNTAFLSGSVLAGQLGSGLIAFPAVLRTPQVLALMSAATVATEFTIAIGLWFRRSRGAAIGLAVLLHVSIVALIAPTIQLVVFATELMVLYPLFIGGHGRLIFLNDSCSRCRRWVRRFRRLDLFGLLSFAPMSEKHVGHPQTAAVDDVIGLVDEEFYYTGFEAVRRILGLLPATYLLAPFLGLPGPKQLGSWWYRRVAEPLSHRNEETPGDRQLR